MTLEDRAVVAGTADGIGGAMTRRKPAEGARVGAVDCLHAEFDGDFTPAVFER